MKFIRLSRSDEALIVVQDMEGVEFSTNIANVTFASDVDKLTPKSIEDSGTPKS